MHRFCCVAQWHCLLASNVLFFKGICNLPQRLQEKGTIFVLESYSDASVQRLRKFCVKNELESVQNLNRYFTRKAAAIKVDVFVAWKEATQTTGTGLTELVAVQMALEAGAARKAAAVRQKCEV